MERNKNIDFFRGFAALWIILIHTCFHSGGAYVPTLVKTVALIIDIPLFMFLSGYSLRYSEGFQKNIKRLVRMYIYYLVFLVLFFIIAIIEKSEGVNLTNFVNAMFFRFSTALPLPSFRYSVWFIPMYFVVTSVGSLFLKEGNLKRIHLIFIFILYGASVYYFKNQNLAMFLMYLFIYCLGYYSFDKPLSIKKFIIFIVIILGLNVLYKFFGPYGFRKIQNAKFDYDIYYLIYSMISILIVWFINTRVKINIGLIPFIGKNAILIYFSQGFSSSLLYRLEPSIHVYWLLKLIYLFAINLCVCLALFVLSYKLFEILKKPINKALEC